MDESKEIIKDGLLVVRGLLRWISEYSSTFGDEAMSALSSELDAIVKWVETVDTKTDSSGGAWH